MFKSPKNKVNYKKKLKKSEVWVKKSTNSKSKSWGFKSKKLLLIIKLKDFCKIKDLSLFKSKEGISKFLRKEVINQVEMKKIAKRKRCFFFVWLDLVLLFCRSLFLGKIIRNFEDITTPL